MDGDGQVELLLSHGESASEPLTMYSVTEGNANNYIRYNSYFRRGGSKLVRFLC